MKKKKRKAAAAAAGARKHSDAAASPQTQEQEAVVPLLLPEAGSSSSSASASELEKDAPRASDDESGIQTDASLSSPEELKVQPIAEHVAVHDDGDGPPDLFTPQEATKVLERFFTVLVMANIPVHVALKPFCGQRLAIEKIAQVLQQAGLPSNFVPTERKAFRSLSAIGSSKQENTDDTTNSIGVQVIFDHASAIAFRVEICEFQIRSAVREYAAGAAKAPKVKVDFQRIVAKLTFHLPAADTSTSAAMITSGDFECLLEEKLGVTPGSFLVKIVFARITGRPFQRSFPKVLEANKPAFCEAFERFCVSKPLSVDSVEGQLHQLVVKFPDMRAVFQRMDLDGSGTISTQEFVTFLQREGNMHFPDEVLTAFIKRFDVDGDGTLSYDEFVEFVRPKQFGINVLSPFGMFYLAVDRLEKMSAVVEKVKTRMFWLQHNDLFAVASAASSASAAATRVDKVKSSQQPTVKLKVTDNFILTHHFGATRLEFEPKDPIVNVLANGELVVLILVKDGLLQSGTLVARSKTVNGGEDLSATPFPAFEYRLKPTTKRNLPPLFSTTEMMRSTEQKVSTKSSSQSSNNGNSRTTIRKLSATRRKPSTASATSTVGSVSRKSSSISVRRADEMHAEAHKQDEWDDTMSSISCDSVSASPMRISQTPASRHAHQEEPPNRMQTHQRDTATRIRTEESTVRPIEGSSSTLALEEVHSSPVCSVSPSPSQSHDDSDTEAFEFFNGEEVDDDDADDNGDEALPAVTHDDDLSNAVPMQSEPRRAAMSITAQVEDDDDDDTNDESPPPYDFE